MKCAMCNRPLTAAAVSIPTRAGPLAYGPKCAGRAGLLDRRQRRRAFTQPVQQEPDPLQIDLFKECAA